MAEPRPPSRRQLAYLAGLSGALGIRPKPKPETYAAARKLIGELGREMNRRGARKNTGPA